MSYPAGYTYNNLTVTVSSAQSVVLNPAASSGISQHNGKVMFHNPNVSATIFLGLAGETLSLATPVGVRLPPSQSLIFDLGECPQNSITAISDTASVPLTIYTIGG